MLVHDVYRSSELLRDGGSETVCVCVRVRACVCAGDNQSPWVRHKTQGGSSYYFHLQRLEGEWERPKGFVQNSLFLGHDEIQVTPLQAHREVLPLPSFPNQWRFDLVREFLRVSVYSREGVPEDQTATPFR